MHRMRSLRWFAHMAVRYFGRPKMGDANHYFFPAGGGMYSVEMR